MTTPQESNRTTTPSVREIAALTARLRELSARGRDADPAARAAFIADKDALIARITASSTTEDRLWGASHSVDAGVDGLVMPEWMYEQAARAEAEAKAAAWTADGTEPGRPDHGG